MTRNAKILDIFLRRAKRRISHTRLMKLAYMADLLAWRVLGEPISEFKYCRYTYGPFDQDFYGALEELYEAGRAEAVEKTTVARNDCTLLKPLPSSTTFEGEFTHAQKHLVGIVIKRYIGLKLDKLLKTVVYETEPMRAAKQNEPLPMEAQKNKDRDAVGGISLETILESRDSIARGDHVTLEELKGEILDVK